mgnify:FL=1
MKFIVQKETGLGETTVFEAAGPLGAEDIARAYQMIDERLMSTNRKIVEAREFIQQVHDPHYRYMFTAFLDNFLGVSGQAEPLLRKFGIYAPGDYEEWLQKQLPKDKPSVQLVPKGPKGAA